MLIDSPGQHTESLPRLASYHWSYPQTYMTLDVLCFNQCNGSSTVFVEWRVELMPENRALLSLNLVRQTLLAFGPLRLLLVATRVSIQNSLSQVLWSH